MLNFSNSRQFHWLQTISRGKYYLSHTNKFYWIYISWDRINMRYELDYMAQFHGKYDSSYTNQFYWISRTLNRIHMRYERDSWLNLMVNITKVTLMIWGRIKGSIHRIYYTSHTKQFSWNFRILDHICMRNGGESMPKTHRKYYPSQTMTLGHIHMRHERDSWLNFMVNITKVTIMIFFLNFTAFRLYRDDVWGRIKCSFHRMYYTSHTKQFSWNFRILDHICIRNEGEPMANTHTKYYPSYTMTLDRIHMRHERDSWLNFVVYIALVTLMIIFFEFHGI